jgi:SAM-dependent methyltransferase
MRRRSYAALLGLAVAWACQPVAPDIFAAAPHAAARAPQGSGSDDTAPRDDPSPPGTYLGRELAPTMTFHGADWLTRPERDDEEDTSGLHARLGLRPGQVACDIGAGNGYHTLKMASAVAPGGTAVAVDIQPEMLELLAARAEQAGITNVRRVTSTPDDPKLAAGTCDLILLVDVYHELSDPATMLGHLRDALSPTGTIALLEFRGEDPDVPIKALHKMTKAQILREFSANGLRLAGEYDGLPWQHLMFFAAAPK